MSFIDTTRKILGSFASGALERNDALDDAHGDDWGAQLKSLVSRDFRGWERKRDYDWRKYGWPGDKSRAQIRGPIAWRDLDTLIIHTTDTGALGPDRFLGMPVHFGIPSDGSIVLCHPLNRKVWHAHAANSYSSGMEVAGRGTISDAQVVAGRLAIRYWVDEVRRQRFKFDINNAARVANIPLYIAPHRHSHSSRRKDPDRVVWEALGEWAIDELPNVHLGRVVGTGKRIPERGAPW